MVRSAPQISFSATSINYGTIDVGASAAATQTYHIFMPQNSTTMTEALNMSISFKSGVNAGEAMAEEWVRISTVDVSTHIGSIGTGTEAWIGSVVAGTGRHTSMVSVYVQTNIVVPSGAATAGAVTFYLHHRYQYTGDDDDYAG